MILAVALNPALDLTYELDTPLRAGATNRVAAVHSRPGGKALNVARILGALDRHVRVLAPVGGPTGSALTEAAVVMRSHGAEAAIASDGSNGLVGATPDGLYRVRPPVVDGGNATGAGDSCVAGLVAASLDGLAWPDRLRVAAALGAMAARTAVAGELGDPSDVEHRIERTEWSKCEQS